MARKRRRYGTGNYSKPGIRGRATVARIRTVQDDKVLQQVLERRRKMCYMKYDKKPYRAPDDGPINVVAFIGILAIVALLVFAILKYGGVH